MAYVWLTPTRHQEAAVSIWVEDPNEPSGWRWDRDAPDADPSVTHLLNIVTPPPDEPEVERIRPRNDLDAAGEEIR